MIFSQRSGAARGLALLGLLAVAACDQQVQSAPPSERVLPDAPLTPVTEVSDSAGVEMILNRGPGLLDMDDRLELREKLVLGGLDVPEPEQFFRISAIKINERGEVFVANRQDGTIRVFDAEGEYMYRFGGLGEGPGEMGDLDRIFFVGDTVVAIDNGGRGSPGETILFASTGEFLGSWYDIRAPGATARITRIGPQGWIGTVNRFGGRGGFGRGGRGGRGGDDAPTEPDTIRVEQRKLFLLDPEEGTIGDSLYLFPERYEYRIEDGSFQSPLFEPVFGEGIDRYGRYYIGQSFPYRINVYGQDGALERVIAREVPIWPLGAGEIEAIRREIREYYDSVPDMEPSVRRERTTRDIERIDRRASLPLPEAQPITGRLFVSDDGSLWVERRDDLDPGVKEFERSGVGAARRRSRPTYWDLFDPSGRYLGEVELPRGFEIMSVDGLEIAGVTRDEYDLEYVVVLEVVTEDRSTQPPTP